MEVAHPERTMRIGVIGGGIVGTHHAATFSKLDSVELVAVCDLEEERARHLAEQHGASAWYTDAADLLRRGDLDAVSVATPDHAHTALVLAAIDAGLHVLCEKPLAMTAAESAEIVDRAQQVGVIVAVDFQNRVNPPFIAARSALLNGSLGSVRHGYLRLSNTTFVPMEMLSWASHSSALWFLGSHGIDLLRFLLQDEVFRVFAVKRDGLLARKGVATEDFYVAILEFAGGPVITIEHSWILPRSQPIVYDFKVELVGEDGALYVDTSHSRVIEFHSSDGMAYGDVLAAHEAGNGRVGGFIGESIARFADSVLRGAPPLATATDGLRVVQVLEAVERSATTGVPVEL